MSDLLTTKEAASRLDVSEDTVRRLIYAGSIQAEKAGRHWVISAASLQAYRDNPPERKPVQPAVERWSPVGKAATEPGASGTPAAGAVTRTRFPQKEYRWTAKANRSLILDAVAKAGGR